MSALTTLAPSPLKLLKFRGLYKPLVAAFMQKTGDTTFFILPQKVIQPMERGITSVLASVRTTKWVKQHCIALQCILFGFPLSSMGRVIAKMAGMVREPSVGRVICSGHLASQWQCQDQKCWISVLGRSLSIIPLKQTSCYLVTLPNALSTMKAEILSFILPVSTTIDVLANTVKEDLLHFQVTRGALSVHWSWQRPGSFTALHNIICQVLYKKELSYKGPCSGGGQPCAMLARNRQAQGKARVRNWEADQMSPCALQSKPIKLIILGPIS